MKNAPTMTQHEDGRITVDEWPDEVDFSRTLLANADPRYVVLREGGRIHVRVDNGEATYLILEPQPPDAFIRNVVRAVRLYASMS